MGTYQFKKFNFYSPSPKAIHCLSFNPILSKLALSRSDNTLEIWDVRHSPHIDRIFISDKNDSIESISWFKDRLFTCGMGCSVNELDLKELKLRYELPVMSGSCWCIDINSNESMIAAGTEDGYINIIKIYDDCLMHERLLDKQEGRILCIAWGKGGEFLATGSVDAIRIWNVQTGHAIHKFTPGRVESHKPTVVWCLTITSDFTIISGDSRGKITFWDGFRGVYIDSHQSHEADVLAICLNNDESKLYCAGVDPLIASFEKINVRGSGASANISYKWIKSIQRSIHDHDVRALTMCEDKLFSGGVDGYLALSSYPPKVMTKYSPILQTKKIHFAYDAKMILITYDEHMEIWQWSFNASLSHVAMIKSYKNIQIRCSSISSDGSWIAYSTDSIMKNSSKSEIKRISGLPSEIKTASVCLCFSPDSKYLVSAGKNKIISVAELSVDENIRLLYQLNVANTELTDIIHLIHVSTNCDRIIAADRSSNIVVWNESQLHCSLPKYDSAPTAMAVNSKDDYVVISYADHRIVEFSLKKKKYTSFSKALSNKHPKQWLNRQFPVEGILYDPQNTNVIMVYDDTAICIIDKTKKLPEVRCKIPRIDTVRSPDNSDNSESSSSQFSLNGSDDIAFHALKEFKHLVYLNVFGEDELVVVVVDPDALTQKLPPTLFKKRFGTM